MSINLLGSPSLGGQKLGVNPMEALIVPTALGGIPPQFLLNPAASQNQEMMMLMQVMMLGILQSELQGQPIQARSVQQPPPTAQTAAQQPAQQQAQQQQQQPQTSQTNQGGNV